MTFDTDETGIESSIPRDLYEFILPTVNHRLTSASRDVVHNGQTFRAGTIQRADTRPATAESAGELEISMIVTHALPQRYLRAGIPPKRINVNVYRKQTTSAGYELAWVGIVVGMSCERHLAKLLVAQSMSAAIPRRIPTITVGRECAHVLYDSGCRVARASFRVATTVSAINGPDLTVASIDGKPNGWGAWGELVHVASGEKMTIQSQEGTFVRMQMPIPDMQAGDAVEIYAGCDRSVATCFEKFANQVNFGGFPQLPKRNPFVSNGLGVVEQ